MKDLGINLTKYVQGVYKKKYKTLVEETRELNKWRVVPYSWQEEPILSRRQFSAIWSIDSRQSQSKSQQVILWLLTNQSPNLCGEVNSKEPKDDKQIWRINITELCDLL